MSRKKASIVQPVARTSNTQDGDDDTGNIRIIQVSYHIIDHCHTHLFANTESDKSTETY